jgi:hypothetical protein
MRMVFVKLALTAIALGVTPGLAQNLEQVKAVFEHIIPNAQGESMVAVIVVSWIAVLRKTSCSKQYCSRGDTYEFRNFAVRQDLDRDCPSVRTVCARRFFSICCG